MTSEVARRDLVGFAAGSRARRCDSVPCGAGARAHPPVRQIGVFKPLAIGWMVGTLNCNCAPSCATSARRTIR